MKCYIGIGTNLQNRKKNIERAIQLLESSPEVKKTKLSPIVENPALVPENAPIDWQKPYLNAVLEVEWSASAPELLNYLKEIEKQMGRSETAARWSPRLIDLDLLLFGQEQLKHPQFEVPHKEMWNRSFVLDAIKHLNSEIKIPGSTETALQRSRSIGKLEKSHIPIWMGILNVTPDSFSDGGRIQNLENFDKLWSSFEDAGVHIVDIGAESTRPGAQKLSPLEEWGRLEKFMSHYRSRKNERTWVPQLSVDTYHFECAQKAIEMGAEIINDVSGLQDKRMLSLIKDNPIQYVLMHSLSVPADPSNHIDQKLDVVEEVKKWALIKIEELQAQGVGLNQIIFDPGIGFGKTAFQSLVLLKRVHEFLDLPVRLLIGHSRKSFMNIWDADLSRGRDLESIGVSLQMAQSGADIIRVHEPLQHIRSYRAFCEVKK